MPQTKLKRNDYHLMTPMTITPPILGSNSSLDTRSWQSLVLARTLQYGYAGQATHSDDLTRLIPDCSAKKKPRHFTLKLHIRKKLHRQRDQPDDHEVVVSNHLKSIETNHPGQSKIRKVHDAFEITGPTGVHQCLIYKLLGMNLSEFLNLLPENRFAKELTQRTVQLLLIALDYMHLCDVVHTGLLLKREAA